MFLQIEVEVCPGGQKVTFPGQGWLRSEDGKVERELHLATPTPSKLILEVAPFLMPPHRQPMDGVHMDQRPLGGGD